LASQRGDDYIKDHSGNDLLIGDGGTNTITHNMDFPKIYEVYRAISAPAPFIIPKFGAVFTIDYKLFPSQYRQVDSLGSIIDLAVNMDDMQEKSNLLHDIIGIFALETGNGTCLQPMFGAVPGFLNANQRVHGNDTIVSGSGQSIVIGDDIRGDSGLDLSQFSDIELVRERIDDVINSLGVRLSTLEVDTERFGLPNDAGKDMLVGCDNITTDAAGSSLVIGDTLTILGRTYKADGVNTTYLIQIAKDVLERFLDIELVLVDFHFALYELHHDLLTRAIQMQKPSPPMEVILHTLKLADDIIYTHGKFIHCMRKTLTSDLFCIHLVNSLHPLIGSDIVIGDSAALFVQADRPMTAGFAFEGVGNSVDQNIEQALSAIRRTRETQRDTHAETVITPSSPLGNSDQNKIPFDDVPFVLSIGTDKIHMNEGRNLAVGDFAVLGGVATTKTVVMTDLSAYVESVEQLRKRPVVSLNMNDNIVNVFGYGIDFYNGRYDSQVSKQVQPSYHGDFFYGNSSSNVILGDYWTSYGYEQLTTTGEFVGDASSDESDNAFGQWDNARWTMFAGDTVNVVAGTNVDSQKVNC
jgi:hypothetical protein